MNKKQTLDLINSLSSLSNSEIKEAVVPLLHKMKRGAIHWGKNKSLPVKTKYKKCTRFSTKSFCRMMLYRAGFKENSKQFASAVNELGSKVRKKAYLTRKFSFGPSSDNIPKWCNEVFYALEKVSPIESIRILRDNLGLTAMILGGIDELPSASNLLLKISYDPEVIADVKARSGINL